MRVWMLMCLAGSLAVPAQSAEPLRGLLLTGGCCHDYESQKHIVTQGLGQRANIEFDVIHEGGDARDFRLSKYEDANWASGYDVIIHNECFGETVDEELVKRIAQAHFNGVPAVFIHCSLHSYRKSGAAEMWRELIGVTSTSHERQRAVTVRTIDSHSILKGFPASWRTPNGELYKIEKIWPNCTPLAQAFGEDTQQDHVVIWTNTFGGTRVFGTSLGHHNETMNTDEWLGLVSRGTLWAAGKLGDDGEPQTGYGGSGIKTIELPKLAPEPDPGT